MKHTLCTLALLLALTPAVSAQEHQHQPADTTRAMPMEHGGMMDHEGMMSMDDMQAMMPQMMRMHERMMADSAMHRMMMADSEMRQMMQEMMGGDHDMAGMRERMSDASPEERRQMMEGMHARVMERMQAMEPEQRRAMMQRMMQMHQKMMADPAMREQMMADPEMRRMMEGMREPMQEGGMMPGGMDHGGMMKHDQMNGMDHGRMGPMSADDVRAAEAAGRTADRFHTALDGGDRAAVEALLLPDAVVLEGGKAEARAEYLGHHFGSDTAFLAAVEREPLTRKTDVAGDAAWVALTSRLHGTYDGRTLDLDSAELLVLRRDASAPDGWRVAAVHWSSRSRD
jgi:hypothetical protein